MSEENQSHWLTSIPNGNITPGYFEGKFHVHDKSSLPLPTFPRRVVYPALCNELQ